MKYVTEDNSSNYPLRVKLLGLNMDGEDPLVIEDFLLERANKDPEKVIKLYEDKLLSLRMLLLEAMTKRKITLDPSGAYRYGNIFLGMTEDSVLDWMNAADNKSVVELLEQEVNPEYFKEKPIEKKTVLLQESGLDQIITATKPATAPKPTTTKKTTSSKK